VGETVFIGGEYCGKTVSGLEKWFLLEANTGEQQSVRLKMGNNSQWAEDGFYWRRILGNNSQWAEKGFFYWRLKTVFYWRLKTDIRERATAITHKMPTQT